MNRRELLRGLLGTVAIATVASKKIYVLPPANGWRLVDGIYRTGLVGEIYSFTFHPQILKEMLDDEEAKALQISKATLDKTVEEVLKQHEQGKWYSGDEEIKAFAEYFNKVRINADTIYYMGVDIASGTDKTAAKVVEA